MVGANGLIPGTEGSKDGHFTNNEDDINIDLGKELAGNGGDVMLDDCDNTTSRIPEDENAPNIDDQSKRNPTTTNIIQKYP